MMRVLEFLELLVLVFLIPFLIFVVAPFGLAWLIGRIAGACS
jgi:hypothetical protein